MFCEKAFVIPGFFQMESFYFSVWNLWEKIEVPICIHLWCFNFPYGMFGRKAGRYELWLASLGRGYSWIILYEIFGRNTIRFSLEKGMIIYDLFLDRQTVQEKIGETSFLGRRSDRPLYLDIWITTFSTIICSEISLGPCAFTQRHPATDSKILRSSNPWRPCVEDGHMGTLEICIYPWFFQDIFVWNNKYHGKKINTKKEVIPLGRLATPWGRSPHATTFHPSYWNIVPPFVPLVAVVGS